jgi:type IV pilus assembly protein PilQ
LIIFRFFRILSGVLVFSLICSHGISQDKLISIEDKLNAVANEVPALNQKISISVSNVSISEFLRGVANSSGLNINLDPSIVGNVVNNFNDVRVLDILLFLTKEFDLDLSIIGNIINVYKHPVEPLPPVSTIQFDSISNFITLNYQGQSLQVVAKEITTVSGRNVILSPGLEETPIKGYIQDMPFDNALEKLAYSNNLSMQKSQDNFYVLSKADDPSKSSNGRVSRSRLPEQSGNGNFVLETNVFSFDSIKVYAIDAPIDVLIKEVSDKLGISYFISSPISGNTTLNIAGTNYKEFLEYLFNGTPYTYMLQDNIYIFGGIASTTLRDYRIIKLQSRTVNKLLDIFPESMKAGMELKEFPEMNSILVGGPSARIDAIQSFIQKIDKTIPVVLIEVMIVYMNKSYTVATGIEAGIGNEPVETRGTVFPGVDIQLGAETINNLLNSFNGFGSMNIGKVTPNFYLNLKALESQGIVDITSTPKLSTLNGHEASMSIGSTEYYIEERTDLYGAQNPQLTTTNTYKPVEAVLSVNIKPIISGDNQITLEIEVNQSDFTSRITKNAPPGNMTRKFKSMLRVRDQEMVLLGGLEEKKKSDTSAGVPLLSRIPILKWIFSSRTKVNGSTRLNIFIKPTIIN